MRLGSRLILLAALACLPHVQAALGTLPAEGPWPAGPTTGVAEPPAQGTLLLEDAVGDLEARGRLADAAVPRGAWDAMDLVSLSAVEAADGFQFRLEVVSLRDTLQDAILAAIEYEIVFRHRDQVYRVVASAPSETDARGFLERIPAGMDPDAPQGASHERIAAAAVTLDVPSNLVLVSVARQDITDSQGAAPGPGAVIDSFFVDAGYLNDEEPVAGDASWPFVEDRMPDEGVGDRTLPVTHGGQPAQPSPSHATAGPHGASGKPVGLAAEASIVVGAGLALLLAARIGAAVAPFLVGAYSRIVGAEVLRHPVRRLLYDLIQATPGADVPFLRPRVDVGPGTLRYHLRTLTSNGLVVALRKGPSMRYFDSRLDADLRARIALLWNAGTAALVDLVQREPGLHLAAVAARLGIRPPSVLWHMRRAEAANLIQGRRDGRFVRYYGVGTVAGAAGPGQPATRPSGRSSAGLGS